MTKSYRAVAGLALTTSAALVLAGCSNTPQASEEGGSSVTVATAASERVAMEAVVAAFEEKEGIDVELTVADTDNLQTTLRTQLSSGTGPDVFFAWPGDGNPMAMRVLQEAGLVADLSDFEFAAEIPDSFRSVTDVDGSTWVAPSTTTGIGVAYNLSAMEADGYEVPTTWPEMLDLCGTVAGSGKSLLAYGGATGWNTQLTPYALSSTLVYGPNPEFATQMADGNATFADSEWTGVLSQFEEMAEADCFQPDFSGTAYEDSLQLVADGQALGTVQVSASLSAIKQTAPDGTELSLEPLPATDNSDETFMPAALGAAYGMNVDPSNPEGASAFIEYLMSEEGRNLYAETAGAIPAISSDSYELDPALGTLSEYLENDRTVTFPDQLWPNARVQQTLFEVLQQLLSGSTDAQTALTRLDEAYTQG